MLLYFRLVMWKSFQMKLLEQISSLKKHSSFTISFQPNNQSSVVHVCFYFRHNLFISYNFTTAKSDGASVPLSAKQMLITLLIWDELLTTLLSAAWTLPYILKFPVNIDNWHSIWYWEATLGCLQYQTFNSSHFFMNSSFSFLFTKVPMPSPGIMVLQSLGRELTPLRRTHLK